MPTQPALPSHSTLRPLKDTHIVAKNDDALTDRYPGESQNRQYDNAMLSVTRRLSPAVNASERHTFYLKQGTLAHPASRRHKLVDLPEIRNVWRGMGPPPGVQRWVLWSVVGRLNPVIILPLQGMF